MRARRRRSTRCAARASPVERVLLVGGGARSEAVRRIAPAVFGVPGASCPPPGEYVADGAARQAAWVLSGGRAARRGSRPGTT